ncbi:vitamin K epoxide reductase family protein [Tessaracoccus defluvii]|uniref:Vitamin K epoxide reductase family protein n=1 Tax=Tessaracoccus defluvii TaxID=1285901 RepID=A0A7H0H9U4_9ACTN|nr:vitamin K epoxide reductase family protein [Tessaracoccus defluvii]QNP57310.1 vitamin K epoxide reductase family protein [Tessaracoccus defluvii]
MVHDAPSGDATLTAPAVDGRVTPPDRSRYFLFGEMLIFSIVSLVASFVLSYDALVLAGNPDAELACSINAIFDCAKVGLTPQANVFGFPNAFLGLISEPVVMTIAVLGLSRIRFPKWFMFTANIFYFLGVVFAYWLLFQSTFVIGALCPWCLTVTLATTFVFFSMTQWNILEGNLYLPPAALEKARAFVKAGWMTIVLIAWLAAVVLLEVLKWGFFLF